MKSTYVFMALLLSVTVLSSAQSSFQSEKLERVWENNSLDVPESVLPVPEQEILYVSNIGTKDPTEKKGKGFISILSTDGNIKILKWCENLNSPKGMAISGNFLYVTEVDKISRIDIHTGKKMGSFPVEGAKFLNDVTADNSGVIYFTDSGTGTIHKFENDRVSVVLQSKAFPNINGIIMVGKLLYVGTGDKIVSVDPEKPETKDVLTNTGGVDGLARIGKDVFLFSDWPGKISMMKKGESKELLLDTSSSDQDKTADFGYMKDGNRLFVPTFFGNSVVCYELKL